MAENDEMSGFNALLGVRHLGMREDGYWIEIEAGEAHLHDQRLVHGGVILALLDTAMSRAVRHALDAGSYRPTIELTASFLRPLTPGIVRAFGRVIHASKSLSRVEGGIVDAAGRIAATGRATFMKAGGA